MLARACRSVLSHPTRGNLSGFRFCSSGSHSDFETKSKVPENLDSKSLVSVVEKMVAENKTLVFMKGTPQQPRCGFSAQVVRILHMQGVDFDAVDIATHLDIKEAVKEVSSWPTFPQVFLDGEFIGGCDIVTDMHNSGDLKTTLEEVGLLEPEKEEEK